MTQSLKINLAVKLKAISLIKFCMARVLKISLPIPDLLGKLRVIRSQPLTDQELKVKANKLQGPAHNTTTI